jgi:hypothetical protein
MASAGGKAMLQDLSDQIRECLRHAEHCAQKARDAETPTLRNDFLDLERRWLSLARSYDLVERIGDFSKASTRPASHQ